MSELEPATPRHVQPDQMPAPRAGVAGSEHTERPDGDDALKDINKILRGTGHTDLLPDLFAMLSGTEKQDFLDNRMNDFAKVPGDTALQCAKLLEAKPAQVIKAALASPTQKASPPQLRTYLIELTGEDLASITGPTFTKLKAALPGALLTVIPTVSEVLGDLAKHAGFMRWFIETTKSGVAATLIERHAWMAMGETLEKEQLWTEWVDHIRTPSEPHRISGLATWPKDPVIKAKLEAHVGPTVNMDGDAEKKYREDHAGDLKKELDGKPTVKGLLDAIGRAGVLADGDQERVFKELTRLKASADDILALTNMVNLDSTAALRALLAAPDVSSDHLTTYLFQGHQAIEHLANDKTRAAVRAKAPGLRARDLLAVVSRDQFYPTLIDPKHDGLRDWFIDEASPQDLLWFCTKDTKQAARAVRFVEKRVKFDWVRELTPADDSKQLRILVLNMPDADTERFVRESLLGDPARDPDGPKTAKSGAREVDPDVFGGERKRLDETVDNAAAKSKQVRVPWKQESSEVKAWIADLDDAERAKLATDDAELAQIGQALTPDDWGRVVHLLGTSFERTIMASPGVSSTIVDHLHRRPKAEEYAAVDDPAIVQKAVTGAHPNLLFVFPSLTEPKRLAKALKNNEHLLGLLLEGSDPNQVTDLISRDEVIKIALPILEARSILLKKLPRFKHMTARGKAGLERLNKTSDSDGSVRPWIDDIKNNDAEHEDDAKRQGDRLHDVDQNKTLVEKIADLSERKSKRITKLQRESTFKDPTVAQQTEEHEESSVNALALLDMHRAEVTELLNERAQGDTVVKLAELVDLPPDIAVPWIAASDLVRMPNALRWWYHFRDPTSLMRQLEVNQVAVAVVTGALDSDNTGKRAHVWLERMPQGQALTRGEERVLDQLQAGVKEATAMRLLFAVRFGFPAPDSYDAKTVDKLYKMIARLPSGHIQQGRIAAIIEKDIPPDGRWDPGSKTIEIDVDNRPGAKEDKHYEKADQDWLPKGAFQKRYGYDDARFKQLLADGRFDMELDQTGTQALYRLREQPIDNFTATVLHEIGHAVDEILGKRSEPVWSYAQWKEYDMDSGFDAWATELGGWDKVAKKDRAKIQEAVTDAMREGRPVKDLVPSDHPAIDDQYASVGVVKLVREGKTFDNEERIEQNGRVFSANGYYHKLYSLDANAAKVAPSDYALYAPAEYFAESYVEYYRYVDSSPGSTARKGGALASPVKAWFDSHVDKVKFDPRRWGEDPMEATDSPKQDDAGKDAGTA